MARVGMFIPPQGFRHAALLLLTGGVRRISTEASAESVTAALVRLADDLAALADDMRAPSESVDWMRAEYMRIVNQMPQGFDRDAVKAAAEPVLGRLGARELPVEPRDLFLVYAPEDRLPVAAPLAVELTKRRVSVALAEYEVSTAEQVTKAIEHGLAHHHAGAILSTPAFKKSTPAFAETVRRIQVLHEFGPETADAIADWVRRVKKGIVAK